MSNTKEERAGRPRAAPSDRAHRHGERWEPGAPAGQPGAQRRGRRAVGVRRHPPRSLQYLAWSGFTHRTPPRGSGTSPSKRGIRCTCRWKTVWPAARPQLMPMLNPSGAHALTATRGRGRRPVRSRRARSSGRGPGPPACRAAPRRRQAAPARWRSSPRPGPRRRGAR